MLSTIQKILKEKNILFHKNEGITIAKVATADEGYRLTQELLYAIVDTKTVLYLSGGSLQSLYERLAHEEKLMPGAVGLVDERFGPKFHEKSNELMMQQTGLLRYLQMRNIPFYPILQGKTREKTAEDYDEKVRQLHAIFSKNVGLLGIGPDGHTSSIIPNRQDFHNPWFDKERQHLMVSEFDDPNSHYKERVGMTFLGLSMLDLLIVSVFGESKKTALEKVFLDGSEEEIPARFFKRPEIAKKTLFITDQSI